MVEMASIEGMSKIMANYFSSASFSGTKNSGVVKFGEYGE